MSRRRVSGQSTKPRGRSEPEQRQAHPVAQARLAGACVPGSEATEANLLAWREFVRTARCSSLAAWGGLCGGGGVVWAGESTNTPAKLELRRVYEAHAGLEGKGNGAVRLGGRWCRPVNYWGRRGRGRAATIPRSRHLLTFLRASSTPTHSTN